MNQTISRFKTIYRYLLSVVILIAIGVFAKENILSVLLFIPVLILTLPFLDATIDEKIPFLSKTFSRIGISLLFIVLGFSLMKSNKNVINLESNFQSNDVHKYSKYEKLLSIYQSQLTPTLLKERDTAIVKMKTNEAYIKLVNEKNTDIKYIPVLEALGEIFSSYDGENMEINEKTEMLCSQIKGGIELMKDFIGLEYRGGVPVEFADVTNRFIQTYRISGSKDDVIGDANGNTYKVPFDYNLSIVNAVFNPDDKEALDEVGKAFKDGYFNWTEQNPKNKNYRYPQFRFKENFIAYLKQNYPDSKYIPNYNYAMSASELYNAYNENEVSADEQYKGKSIAVTGVIEEIGKDILDEPYIILSGQGFLSDIQCYVPKELATKTNKGERITLVGICDGRVLGANVIMKKCELE